MTTNRNVAVFVGSLRKDSFNRKIAHALAELAPESLKLKIVEIGHLAHYNQDDDVPVQTIESAPVKLGGQSGKPLTAEQESALRERFGMDANGAIAPLQVAWEAMRAQVRSSDAVLFVTPEYNRSVPGVLKNAIDIASRPYGKSALEGKPGAVISASPGAIGGFGANHHLRQSLVFLNVPAMQQPEAYIGGVNKLFDKASGKLTDDDTRDFLRKYMQAFASWIEANRKG
jgi:chromate reductase